MFKKIDGYEYEVSDLGQVRNMKTKKILKPNTQKGLFEYHHVHLYKDGKKKTIGVHRLVALAFVPNPENLLFVKHKDRNNNDNRAENLYWNTPKYMIPKKR